MIARVTPLALLVGFYRDPVPRRMQELTKCLEHNANNEHITEMYVFTEDVDAAAAQEQYPVLRHPKIQMVDHGRRTRYSDFFAWGNSRLVGKVVALANADIYFDDSLALVETIDLDDKLLCLSRWDVQADGSARLFERSDSQDAWIFRAPIRAFPCDFQLGQLGCDNRLAWEAQQAGLKVSNPSRSVRSCHLHVSGVRRASQTLSGEMLMVPPTSINRGDRGDT